MPMKPAKTGNMKLIEVDPGSGQLLARYDGSSVCFGDSGGPTTLSVGGVSGVVGVNSAVSDKKCLEGTYAVMAGVQGQSNLAFITKYVPDADTL